MSTPADSSLVDRRWRLAASLVAVLLAVALYRQFGPTDDPGAASPRPTPGAGQVEVAIQTPDSDRRDLQVAWAEGMTVQQATQLAAETTWRSRGEMALLESIDGVQSQGADGLNWQLWVNGQYATRGAGVYGLEAGDRVLWKLAPYE